MDRGAWWATVHGHLLEESHKHKTEEKANRKNKAGSGVVLGKKGDYIRNEEKLKATYICLITQKNNFF